MTDLKKLKALAENARDTYPLKNFDGDLYYMNSDGSKNSLLAGDVFDIGYYFEKLNPQTILAMIERIEKLEAENDHLNFIIKQHETN